MSPAVTLSAVDGESIAPTVFALVDRAVLHRPSVAAELAGRSVRLELGYPPVRVSFGDDVVVADDDGTPVDTVISGRLPDLSVLIAAPLAGGLPNPTRADGRAALARLADKRVALQGSVGVGRRFLQLLSVSS